MFPSEASFQVASEANLAQKVSDINKLLYFYKSYMSDEVSCPCIRYIFYFDLEQVLSNDKRATRIVLYWIRKESPI